MMTDRDSISNIKGKLEGGGGEIGKALIGLVSGTLVYYHCAYRDSSLFSLMSDVLIVLLCSLAILGLLFRQLNISYFSLFSLSFPFPQFQFQGFSFPSFELYFGHNNNNNYYDDGIAIKNNKNRVPVDPLEWQISQDTANSIVAWFANTIGAAESVLRVAATGHDKRLFFKVIHPSISSLLLSRVSI